VGFNSQESSGGTVTVEAVTLPDGGFVAIRLDNASGEFLGASDYLGPGGSSDIDITLDRAIAGDATLVAVAHRDTNDNEAFEFPGADDPYTDDGGPVSDSATISLPDPVETDDFGEGDDTGAGDDLPETDDFGEGDDSNGSDDPVDTDDFGEGDDSNESDDSVDTEDGGGLVETTTTAGQPGFGAMLAIFALALLQLFLAIRRGDLP